MWLEDAEGDTIFSHNSKLTINEELRRKFLATFLMLT